MKEVVAQGFRLSPQQRRIWRLQSEAEGRPCKACCLALLRGVLDEDLLRRAAAEVVDRFEILRTTFSCPPGLTLPAQQVGAGGLDWSRLPDAPGPRSPQQREEALAELDRLAREIAPDIENGPVLSLRLARLAGDEHALAISLPALCADGVSLRNLAREIAAAYAALAEGRSGEDEPPLQYADLAEWQNELLDGEEAAAGREHWDGWDPAVCRSLRLPQEGAPARPGGFDLQSVPVPVGAVAAERLAALAGAAGVPVSTPLLAAFQILLWRLTGEAGFTLGLVAEGRSYEGLGEAIGPLATHVPLSCRVDGDLPFSSALARAHAAVEAVAEWQELFNWERIAARHGLALDATVFPASFEAEEWPAAQEIGPLTLSLLRCDASVDRVRLKLAVRRVGEDLLAELRYDASRLDGGSVEELAQALGALLAAAAENPELPVARLGLAAQRAPAPAPVSPAPRLPLVHELFALQARRVPERTAVACDGRSLTYAELAGRASGLARILAARGVAPGAVVGIALERSIEMVVAILGVLEAGGAYLPLEPGLPRERKAVLLERAASRVVVTERRFLSTLPESRAVEALCLDDVGESSETPAFSGVAVPDESLVYVIYTSGSTGVPKGVGIEHRQLANYVQGIGERLGLPDGASYAMLSSFAADLGNTVLFPPLCTGGCLHLIPPAMATDSEALAGYFRRHPIDCLKIAPSHLKALLSGAAREALLPRRWLILGGEALRWDWVDELRALDPRCSILNHYGPTEATVGVLTLDVNAVGNRSSRTVPLGRALPHTAVYLLGRELEPLPAWFIGELYLGGAGVARGYLERPDLTAESFLPDPLAGVPGARMYRTGDLARRLPDGTFEFLGRADNQVKVRGFRVELGEIEALLESHPAVRRAAVAAHDEDDGGSKRLAAYVVARDRAVDAGALREFLRDRLPDYMLPAAFVTVDELPLTASGKVDRRALPEPEWNRSAARESFVAPATPEESVLAGIWAEVLRLDRVGIHDDFFQIGGDSIRAIIVRSKAEEQGLSFTVQDLFEQPTIHQLARGLAQGVPAEGKAGAEAFSLLTAVDRERLPGGLDDAYPLSRLQAGMLFHSELDAGTAIYHNLHSFHARVRFEGAALREALEDLVRRHPVLRTSFDLTSFGEVLQLVWPAVDLPLEIHDLRDVPPAEREAAIAGWLRQETLRPFDWTRPPLFRIHVHRRSESELQLTLSFHHAILDGWSVATLLHELFQGYLARLEGATPPAGPVQPGAMRDLVASERAALESAPVQDFWRRELDGAAATRLPWLGQADAEPGRAEGRSLSPPIAADLSEALREAARGAGAPLKSLLLAVHLRVLALLSGESDVVTGLFSHGRPETAEGERALGMFVNTLPFRLRLGGGTWQDLAREAFARERELFPVRHFPLAELLRSRGGQPLFDTAFTFLHYHVLDGLKALPGIEVLATEDYGESNFPLTVTFSLDPLSGRLNLTLLYRWPELDDRRVEAIGGYYLRALAAVAAAPEARHDAADLLSAEERRQVLDGWSRGPRIEPSLACIHDLVTEQARRSPEAVAVRQDGAHLTYGELDALSDTLAGWLRSAGVGPETLVGVALERSLELPVALLGILKAGGAYLPLDLSYPAQRLAYMLEDSAAPVLLAQSRSSRALPEHSARVLFLDPGWEEEARRAGADEAAGEATRAHAGNLAYVIYTSGSTGRPKGVEIPHGALLNLLRSMAREPGLGPDDRLLAVSSLSFDIAGLELFLPLLVGACVELVPAEVAADGPALRARLADSGATVVQATPSTWRMLLEAGLEDAGALRLILCGGEALLSDLAQRLRPRTAELWNVYGPTETTIWSTAHRADEPERGTVAIGRPVANTRVYVLDGALDPVPPGVRGGLYIGGDGVARGYRGRPGLTAERFVPDPQGGDPGARLYRTGDEVRFLADGSLEFLGRSDQQIKVRGFRIEPGEVEVALGEVPGVREAVVSVRHDQGEARLVAWVVAQPEAALTPAALRQVMRDRLPAHLVPSAFVLLDRLPLTPNGKVDRRALPAPAGSRADLGVDFVAPRTALERILAGMWQELLKVDRVGVHDDFFALGGDSLTATQTVMRIRKTFGVDLQLRHIMFSRSIEGVAAALLVEPEQRARVERAAELMVRLAEMSDEEVEAMLREETPAPQESQR